MTALTNDLAEKLLKAYEPVLHFDSENKVLPMNTESYVKQCSLWAGPRSSISFKKPAIVKDWGQISRTDLGQLPYDDSLIYYLSFAQLDPATLKAMKKQGISVTTETIIKEGLKKYAALPQADRAPTYHGRAFLSGNYTVLQYWFFYPINDFKTSHNGINDHEGDWEGISLFLPRVDRQSDTEPVAAAIHEAEDRWWQPVALLAAAHNDSAAKDWASIQKSEEHPRCYVARGSHATYYDPGKHSVDRADGQGVAVGPGTDTPWQRIILPVDSLPAWVERYNGAWGYFSRDALGGFNGPGGLTHTIKYNFFKGFYHTPRGTWANPVGEAGL